jgi:hypothetical protein
MSTIARRALLVAGCLFACAHVVQAQPSSTQVQTVARQAYVYGYPMVDLYRIYYQFFINDQSAEHRHMTNKVYNAPGLLTPDNTTLQSPDADVLYSFALLDLRAQPIVVTLPGVAKNRFYSLQFVDQYTFNIAYAGTRTTGDGGGKFLVAGPGWKGATPQGIRSVIHADTKFVLAVLRTQVFGPDDLPNARKVQTGFGVDELSAYARTPAPRPSPRVNWLLPLSANAQTRGLDFFNLLAFVGQFCPIDPSERELWKSFGTIGIVPGKHFETATMPIDEIKALRMGMTVGQLDILGQRQKLTSSAGVFGDRAQLKGNYLLRAAGAQLGILGNSAQETLSYVFIKDPSRMALSGLLNRYTLRFAPNQLPPVNAFWSLTLYQIPSRLLVQNPLNRYFIDSQMVSKLARDADGGYTIYLQAASPGADLEANWLPAPQAPFYLILRLYYPKPQALQGSWKPPAIGVQPSPSPPPAPVSSSSSQIQSTPKP